VKKIFQEIILFILYATPLGYLLSLLRIIDSEKHSAVYMQIVREKPLNVYVKQSPLPYERLRWIIHGLTLLFQAIFSLYLGLSSKNTTDMNLFGAYVWMAFLSGIFPTFPWNKRLFGISIFEVIFFVSIFSIVYIIVTH
jgi:hypothetical protein